MKYREETRQATALQRTKDMLKTWETLLLMSPEDILSHPEVKITDPMKAKSYVSDKINKAKKCIENLVKKRQN